MASAKGVNTTRRSVSSGTAKKHQDPGVSPARWAGVALVIAAIVGAVFLAVISPSEPGGASRPGIEVAEVQSTPLEPDPSATAIDGPVPVMAPRIVVPADGNVTGEYEISVTVAVPEDRTVEKRVLDLDIYNNGSLEGKVRQPKLGAEVKVDGIRLSPGANALTAVLSSPAGRGPASEPSTVTLDEEVPDLEILAPANKYSTYEDSVTVQVASEVDASVVINNHANGHDPDVTIGPSGTASAVIRLKYGKNRIVATSVDQAGQNQRRKVVVTRLDGRPKEITLKVPKSVKPPEEIKVVAEVIGSNQKPMADAEVHFWLYGANQSTDADTATTNAKGRAVWEVPITASSSPVETLEVGVTVVSPSGERKEKSETIEVR